MKCIFRSKWSRVVLVLALALALGLPTEAANAQGNVTGRVTFYCVTNGAYAGAAAGYTVSGGGYATFTNASGYFSIPFVRGYYSVNGVSFYAHAPGFRSVRLGVIC